MTKTRKHSEIDAAARLIADWRSMAIVHAIYENAPVSYTQIANLLELSPTILSQKLAQLTELQIIIRQQEEGGKAVEYSTEPIAKDMVGAYHALERLNRQLGSIRAED